MIRVKAGSPAPLPDMASRPQDITQFAFAPVCDLDHVTGYGKVELNVKDLEVLTACSTCGRPAKYQTITRMAEAVWGKSYEYSYLDSEFDRYIWRNRTDLLGSSYWWTKAERVRSITL